MSVLVKQEGDTARITLNRPERRNALAEDMLHDLLDAFEQIGSSDATGIVLAAEGPVFSSGHDFADVHGRDHASSRELLQGLATAAGCQLVASCDLAVAAESAGFALPGGKAGWFCHTPAVAVARNISRKHLMEMALTGDIVDAQTAAQWGLVNYTVPDGQLDAAVEQLLARATRGSRSSKALGKQTLRAQLDRPEDDAYTLAIEVMAAASQTVDAVEGRNAFLQKRHPVWQD